MVTWCAQNRAHLCSELRGGVPGAHGKELQENGAIGKCARFDAHWRTTALGSIVNLKRHGVYAISSKKHKIRTWSPSPPTRSNRVRLTPLSSLRWEQATRIDAGRQVVPVQQSVDSGSPSLRAAELCPLLPRSMTPSAGSLDASWPLSQSSTGAAARRPRSSTSAAGWDGMGGHTQATHATRASHSGWRVCLSVSLWTARRGL